MGKYKRGGVLIYIKENLAYSNRSDLVTYRIEMICREIINKLAYNRSFLVATWYTVDHRVRDLFDDYENFIEKCDYENKQLIISGDMNCDYSKINSEAHTQKLQFISRTYRLEQLILNPTG